MKTFKKTLSLLLAVMFVFSAFGVAASAADPVIVMTARDAAKTTFTLTDSNFTANVEVACELKGTSRTAASVKWNVLIPHYTSGTNAGFYVEVGAPTTAEDLAKTYVIFARRNAGTAANPDYRYAESADFVFAPAAPVVTKMTDCTIELQPVAGCEYSIREKGKTDELFYQNTASFSSLLFDTEYDLFIRYAAATQEIRQSAAAQKTVRTYKTAPDKPAAPVLDYCTMSKIVLDLEGVENVEFSIDNGSTWQTSGVFDNLSKSTKYTVFARGVLAEGQLEGEWSKSNFKTASRNPYEANIKGCKVIIDTDEAMAGKSFKVTATGDCWTDDDTDNTNNETYEGDTRYFPVSWETTNCGGASGDFAAGTANAKDVSITPPGATDKLTVTVTFQHQEYSDGEWKNDGLDTCSASVKVRGAYVWYEYILIGLNVALQLAIKGLSWIFGAIGGFLGA